MLFAAGGVVGLLAIGFWIFGLIDVVTAPAAQVRNLQKVVWVIIVLIGLEFGVVGWLIYGRPRERVPAGVPPLRRSPGRRVVAPDDDVDFLRSLNKPRDDGDGLVR